MISDNKPLPFSAHLEALIRARPKQTPAPKLSDDELEQAYYAETDQHPASKSLLGKKLAIRLMLKRIKLIKSYHNAELSSESKQELLAEVTALGKAIDKIFRHNEHLSMIESQLFLDHLSKRVLPKGVESPYDYLIRLRATRKE